MTYIARSTFPFAIVYPDQKKICFLKNSNNKFEWRWDCCYILNNVSIQSSNPLVVKGTRLKYECVLYDDGKVDRFHSSEHKMTSGFKLFGIQLKKPSLYVPSGWRRTTQEEEETIYIYHAVSVTECEKSITIKY